MSDRADLKEQWALFTDLARPHLDSLYRTALRMTKDQSVAEDIVQETCLKAYANLARYEAETNFKAWLFRILTNLCIDHLRRHNAASIIPIDSVPMEVDIAMQDDCRSQSPEKHAIRGDTQRALIDAVATLAPEPRALVLLVLVEGMSYDEAAVSMDISIGTVRSKLHRARKQLQKELGLSLDIPTEKSSTCNPPRVVSLF